MTSIIKSVAAPAVDATEELIQAFADRVRAALSDLPDKDVAELTEGLEESLAEQAADSASGSALPHEGDPTAYASELREAAGLPAAQMKSGKSKSTITAVELIRTKIRESTAAAAEWIRPKPIVGPIFQLAVSLQPLWWVLRVFVAFWVWQMVTNYGYVYALLPYDPFVWIVLLVAIFVSVQWGRGKWLPWQWLAEMRSVVSLALFVGFLAFVPHSVASAYWEFRSHVYAEAEIAAEDTVRGGVSPEAGMVSDGQPVENIFAFDAQGKPLTDVQLFDQAGRPLVTVTAPRETRYLNTFLNGDASKPLTLVPRPIGSGVNVWNVFPLRSMPGDQVDYSVNPNGELDILAAKPTASPKIVVYPLVPLEKQTKQGDS